MQRIVIIGSGMAGYGLARELRKLNQSATLTIISADAGDAYSKPMLSNAVAKGKAPAELISATADTMAQQLDAEIITHTRVSAIDPQHQCVKLETRDIAYDQLVLAVGADPIRLPLAGTGAKAVMSVNDIEDYARFRQALPAQARIAIIGGGLIGCEFANDLAARHEIHLIDRNPLPLGRLLPSVIAEPLLAGLESLGVHWHGAVQIKQITQIQRDHQALQIQLEDQQFIDCDVILSAIGLQARTGLAKNAGLAVNRGIVVDRYLKTSIDNIYALGDCAEVEGRLLPFVLPLMRGSKALAATLAGNRTAVSYPAMPVMLKTPVYPVAVLPPSSAEGAWKIDELDGTLRAIHIGENGMDGFALGGPKAAAQANTLAKEISPMF